MMNAKRIFKSTVSMIMAPLIITAGAAAATTSAVEMGNITASAISVHNFEIKNFKAYNPNGGDMKNTAPVEFSFDLSAADAGPYNTYMTSYIKITKDGVNYGTFNFKAGDKTLRFNPKEAGTYTALIYVIDYNGNEGKKTITFNVKNRDAANITVVDFAGKSDTRTIGFTLDGLASDAHIDSFKAVTPSGKLTVRFFC